MVKKSKRQVIMQAASYMVRIPVWNFQRTVGGTALMATKPLENLKPAKTAITQSLEHYDDQSDSPAFGSPHGARDAESPAGAGNSSHQHRRTG